MKTSIIKNISIILFTVCSLLFTISTAQALSAVEVLIMLDLSAGTAENAAESQTGQDDLGKQKEAAISLINFFATQSIQSNANAGKPKIAVGGFFVPFPNTPENAIRAFLFKDSQGNEVGLTTNYDRLIKVVNDRSGTSGVTDISAAIDFASNHLIDKGEDNATKYLILISDAVPNRPGNGGADDVTCGTCGCDASRLATEQSATRAKARGISLITVHFEGTSINGGGTASCANQGEPQRGKDLLKNKIASSPLLAFENNNNLNSIFNLISCSITCDDGDPCTQDLCQTDSSANSICQSVIIDSQDTDGDGIVDCQDSCFGDNNLIGSNCTFSNNNFCLLSGVYECSSSLACKANATDIAQCFNCSISNFSQKTKRQLQKIGKDLRKNYRNYLAFKSTFNKKTQKKYLRNYRKGSNAVLELQGIVKEFPEIYNCATNNAQETCSTKYYFNEVLRLKSLQNKIKKALNTINKNLKAESINVDVLIRESNVLLNRFYRRLNKTLPNKGDIAACSF